MARWKLFGRSKSIDEEPECEESFQIETEETILSETDQDTEDSTMVEYHETLYSKDSKSKKLSKSQQTHKSPSDQRIWRDVNSIEENIDGLDKSKLESSAPQLDNDINKAVDKLLSKKKR